MPEDHDGLAPAESRYRALLDVSAAMGEQPTILDGVPAWSHGPLADDVSLVIVEVR
jgi:hypothetical protein